MRQKRDEIYLDHFDNLSGRAGRFVFLFRAVLSTAEWSIFRMVISAYSQRSTRRLLSTAGGIGKFLLALSYRVLV